MFRRNRSDSPQRPGPHPHSPVCDAVLPHPGLNPNPKTLHPTPDTLHPTPYNPHPTPYTLHPTPFTLHPSPYTLHPTPHTLRRKPYTLHPKPYTLHPTPHTPHPSPYTLNPCGPAPPRVLTSPPVRCAQCQPCTSLLSRTFHLSQLPLSATALSQSMWSQTTTMCVKGSLLHF